MKVARKSLIFTTCTIIGLLLYVVYLWIVRDIHNWQQRTTPLPNETVELLCQNFDLEPNHQLCARKKNVYGPDFYKIVRDTFRPSESYSIVDEASTYDQVEEKIGTFKYECDSIIHQADDFSYFICRYDFRGDRKFIIGIMYTYPEKKVFRVNTPMGSDGE